MEADHQAHTDGHIGISGKIQIDLKHEEQHAHPKNHRRLCGKGRGVLGEPGHIRHSGVRQNKLICQKPAGIGQHRFLRQARRKPVDSPGHLAPVDLPI